jgi:hypothetical protein
MKSFKSYISEGSHSFKDFKDPWAVMSPEDRKEANRLFRASMKAMPSSIRQKELQAKLFAIMRKYKIGVKEEQASLEESSLWGIAVFAVLGLLAIPRISEVIYLNAMEMVPKEKRSKIKAIAQSHMQGKAVSTKDKADAIAALRKGVAALPSASPSQRKAAIAALDTAARKAGTS